MDDPYLGYLLESSDGFKYQNLSSKLDLKYLFESWFE